MAGRRGLTEFTKHLAGAYSVEHAAFWLLDPRLTGLTGNDRHVFFILGLLCIVERSETLPKIYINATFLQQKCGVDARTIQKSLAKLLQNCLVKFEEDGALTVIGIRDRHKNFNWKNRGYIKDKSGAKKAHRYQIDDLGTFCNVPNPQEEPSVMDALLDENHEK